MQSHFENSANGKIEIDSPHFRNNSGKYFFWAILTYLIQFKLLVFKLINSLFNNLIFIKVTKINCSNYSKTNKIDYKIN